MASIVERVQEQVRERPWLDHLVRAGERFQRQRGDYFAAGITYFTVLAMFPVLMLAFSVAGFVLSRQPELLAKAHDQIVNNVPGSMGKQLTELIDRAVASRTGVGVLGLVGALYAGVGWMANLRAALSEQWEQQPELAAWWKTKLADLASLLGLLLALAVSLGLSAVSAPGITKRLLRIVHLDDVWGVALLLKLASLALALAASWVVFTWIIARLPRQGVALVAAAEAGALAAVVFEAFKHLASIYLGMVLRSPAGAVFGSVIGIMVFCNVTYRIILFATAWAATTDADRIEPPAPAVITPRVRVITGPTTGQTAGLLGLGAALGLGLSRWRRRAG